MSTSERRRPMNTDINGYGTVSSSERYTLEEAVDIQRMVVEVVEMVTDGREEFRIGNYMPAYNGSKSQAKSC